MTSFVYDIGEKARVGSRFIDHVRQELLRALYEEKNARKVTQQSIANRLGVDRSVVNRRFMGLENMTIRSLAETLWALGWEADFRAVKPAIWRGQNEFSDSNKTGTDNTTPGRKDEPGSDGYVDLKAA